jgi:ABC-type lipoprotein export system ATPase subunit
MKINDYPRGSEWRRWDLHVHSPNSCDCSGTWDQFCKQLKNANCDVIGINDYCCISGYKKIKEKIEKEELDLNNKIILPVVEFRMRDVLKNSHTGQSGENINFHIIFSDEIDIGAIETFIKSIKNDNQLIGNKYSDSKYLKEKVKVYFEKQIINELKDSNDFKDKFLIWLPYNEYGGIGEIDPQSDDWIKRDFIRKADILGSSNKKQIDFFLWKSPLKKDGKPKFSSDDFGKWFDRKKPCIKGSDSHNCCYPIGKLRDSKSNPTNKYCWIKADPTFEGLKQIIYEPEERVLIDEQPDIFQRVKENKTKFIKSLEIDQAKGYKENKGIWFKNIKIPINFGMVAIIGNKGSGKSALTDILSLCGNSHRYIKEDFSFLTQDRFLKHGLAKNFEAKLIWENNEKIMKNLSEGIDENAPERVQYLPQKYFENLTNDLELYQFEKTLKDIVFNHLPNEQRLNKKSFNELIDFKEENVNKKIKHKFEEIKILSKKLIELDKKKHPDYKKQLNSNLNLKNEELNEHDKNKPVQVADPSENESVTIEQKSQDEEVKVLNEQLIRLEDKIIEKENVRNNLILKSEDLDKVKKDLEDLKLYIDEYVSKYNKKLKELNISITDLLEYNIDFDLIEAEIKKNKNAIENINDLLMKSDEIENIENSIRKKKVKNVNLVYKKEEISKKIGKIKEKLSEPQKKCQRYIEELKKWEINRQKIIGNESTFDTIEWLKKEIIFITDEIDDEIKKLRKQQIKNSLDMYSIKKEIVDTYDYLKKFIDNEINKYRKHLIDYEISVEANFKINGEFCSNLLRYVNQTKKGTFYGKDDGRKILEKTVDSIDFNKKGNIRNFVNHIFNFLDHDHRDNQKKDNERFLCDQIDEKNLSSFYNYLFSLEYLKPTYELKLSNKKISLLSPGEKGALLIIFYLLLDKNNIPLIIDQPEENLDNESIYKILKHFLQQTKKRRQLIIVTHNPNLAIVGDAEQIIYVKIDKENKNKFIFESGSIESPNINKHASDILEGTMKAFDVRRLKYFKWDSI